MDRVRGDGRSLLKDPAVDHVGGLDGIRGIAVALIVVYHFITAFWLAPPTWIQGGFIGVDVFFVLSGFLIASLLLRERDRVGRVQMRMFYERRIARLIPALLLLFVAHGAYVVATGMSKRGELHQMTSILFGFNNYPAGQSPSAPEGMQHLWSLSIEWQFYLVIPVLIGFLLRRVSDRIAMVVIFSLILAIISWRLLLHRDGVSVFLLYARTDTRADAMLAGVLLAYSRRHLRVSGRWAAVLGWLGTAILIWGVTKVSFLQFYLYEPIIVAGTVMMLMAALSGSGPSQFFEWSILQRLGKVSYAVYLWHLFIFLGINYFYPHWPVMTKVVVGLGVTALATAVSWYVIEQPVQRVQRRRKRLQGASPTVEPVEPSNR